MKILVFGAGAWGTALAVHACRQHAVQLWARSASDVAAMQATRVNDRYLPGIALPAALQVLQVPAQRGPATAGELDVFPASISSKTNPKNHSADLVVLAVPVSGVREWLLRLSQSKAPVIWLCKGLERRSVTTHSRPVADASTAAQWASPSQATPSAQLVHEIAASVAPGLHVGALSGPSFAQEVAAGLPCALVAASPHRAVRQAMVQAFHAGNLRVYENEDLLGVGLGGAVKNVYAIAAGLCDGLNLGLNARAALLTRAMAELTRLGVAMGAKPETFLGLSGMGDMLLTATGDLSRNRQVGLALARGQALADITAALGHVAEGVLSAPAVAFRAAQMGVEMPIVGTVLGVLTGECSPKAAVAALLARPMGSE